MSSFGPIWRAAIAALAYLVIHSVEGEGFTPMIVARRFTLNPVLVVLSLISWFWMWGIAGALLAVPLLAIFKDDLRPRRAADGGRTLPGRLGARAVKAAPRPRGRPRCAGRRRSHD